MKICNQSTEQIEQEIESWVEESTTKIEQVCSQVTTQIEQWQTGWETRCSEVAKQVCGWLPWPINQLCNWVTETVCSVVSVLIKVLAVVVSTVCNTITTIIKALKKIIAKILVPFVKLICVFAAAAAEDIVDEVPDLAGVNFDRRDPNGRMIPFLWGASTAAFQVEGGIKNNDWHHFTDTQTVKDRVAKLSSMGGTTLRIESAGNAVDHWDVEVLKEDLDRAQFLGLNAYRFSLEWARIQPDRPAWAGDVIEAWRKAQSARAEARAERERARESGDPNDIARHLTRALELEAEAERLDEEVETAIDSPYDTNEFKKEPVEHYVEMIDQMAARGLEPIVTMMHMTLPDWVLMPPAGYDIAGWGAAEDSRYWNSLRGWETRATVAAFRKFVRFVTPFLKDKVKHFVTLNEPIGTVTGGGYMAGVFPPGFLGAGGKGRAVYHNLIDAHIAAYDEIKAVAVPGTRVGVSHWIGLARRAPQTIASKLLIGDNEAAKNQWHYAINQYFLDAIVLGHRNPEIWRRDTPSVVEESKDKVDFIAPQYYRACDIYHDVGVALTASWWGGQFVGDLRNRTDYLAKHLWNDLGWTIYPGGLYRILNDVYGRYGKPLLITENGMCERTDRNRAAYTISHLQQVLRAIKDGVDVIGYVHWSIVDNFEWAFGYQGSAHFGLFTVDRDIDPASTNLKSFPRHITEGALAYQYVIANSRRIFEASSQENPFDAVVSRYGTISADGAAVEPPAQPAGALWEASFPGGDGEPFMLHLARFSDGAWLGNLFLSRQRRWVRLEDVTWTPPGPGTDEGTLVFSYGRRSEESGSATYTAHTVARGSSSTASGLEGTLHARGSSGAKWRAERVPNHAIWKATLDGYEPTHVAFRRYEGPFDTWRGKHMHGKRIWSQVEEPITWNGLDVSTWLPGVGDFDGTVSGNTLSATITLIGGGGGAQIPWVGTRLEDDIPFR